MSTTRPLPALAPASVEARAVRRARAVLRGALLSFGLGACALAPPQAPAAQLVPAGAQHEPLLESSAGQGARWLALGTHEGPEGPVLAGRFSAHFPPFAARRTVLVQGLDAHGALLFERRAIARPDAAPTRRHTDRPASFSLLVPQATGLATLSVSVPAPAAPE